MEFLTINLKQLDVMNHCESVHEHPFTQVAMHMEGNHPKCQYTQNLGQKLVQICIATNTDTWLQTSIHI